MINEKDLKKLNTSFRHKPVSLAMETVLFKTAINDASRVMKKHVDNQFRFSIDLKTLPVTNQKQSGRCWIFSALNFLREETAHITNVNNIELSQNYIAFYDKLEKINFFLETIIDLKDREVDDRLVQFILQTSIQDGGQWTMFANLVKKYGVIPQDAMPETIASSATSMVNNLIDRRLKKFAAEVREPNANVAKLKEKALDELYSLLASTFGEPPVKFDFEYVDKDGKYHFERNLNAHSFYDKFVKINLDDYVSLINSPTDDKPFYHRFVIDYLNNVIEGEAVTHLNLPLSEFKKTIVSQLKDQTPVWFGSDVALYGARDEGIWDDEQYAYQDLFGLDLTDTKAHRLDYRASAMNHAMLLTGVNLVNDSPTKWKIENSWGDKSGDKGYYLASSSWFDQFAYQAVVHKKYLTPEAISALDTDVIHLKPWDPMGTLAD